MTFIHPATLSSEELGESCLESYTLLQRLNAANAALLRYAKHDRGCRYPDRECACGLAAVINPLVIAACSTPLPPHDTPPR